MEYMDEGRVDDYDSEWVKEEEIFEPDKEADEDFSDEADFI